MSSIKSQNKSVRICIVGAGLAGSMMAILLAKLGYRVTVYEKREDPRVNDVLSDEFGPASSPSKRSINLALSYRGILGLQEIGVLDQVMAHAIPMPRRVIHHSRNVSLQPYGTQDECIWSICRNTLNVILLNTATLYENISVYYGHTLVSIDKSGLCQLCTYPDRFTFECQFDLVIGADGAFSTVRAEMMKIGRVNYSRQFIDMGYKELRIPPRIDESGNKHYALEYHNGLHIWPRGKLMLIALPNSDKSFTATLFAPYSGPEGFTALSVDGSDDKIQHFFHNYFPDISSMIPSLIREFKYHPVGSLMTSRVNPWYVGKTLLIGDAAHAILPFLGQGMNSAFEDAYQFYKLIQSNDYNLHKAAQIFSKSRQPSVETLADMSEAHYRDMAMNTSSTWYLMKRRFESFLRKLLPNGWFVPKYVMIAFTDIPYNQIKEREENQQTGITILLSMVTMMTAALFSEGSYYLWSQSSVVNGFQQLPNILNSLIISTLRFIKPSVGMR